MNIKHIIKLFEQGSVQICGMRGTGKDLLTSNVIARRKKPYISNLNYGYNFIPFDYNKIKLNNTHDNFINGNINKYEYPYEDGIDIYLSDCGIYFPAQYCSELDKKYKDLPIFASLQRQLNLSSLHTNAQFIGRVWNKLREQGDIYIKCNWCKVLFKCVVIQKITIYEKYESCANNIQPLRLNMRLNDKNARNYAMVEKTRFLNTYGKIKPALLIYLHKGKYNTRAFKEILKNGGLQFEDKN